MYNEPRVLRYDFLGNGKLTVADTAGGGPLVQHKTGSNTPDIVHEGGYLKIALTADEEAQVNCAYFGDDLSIDVDDIKQIRICAKCTAIGAASVVEAIFGVASEQADDPDSIAEGIFWRVKASNAVVLESDDGTTNVDDTATNDTLSTTDKLFVLDFDTGVLMRSPLESGSVGGKSHIQAQMNDSAGQLRPVCRSTVHTLNAYSDKLQLIAQIYKSSATDTGTLYIKWIEIELRDPV